MSIHIEARSTAAPPNIPHTYRFSDEAEFAGPKPKKKKNNSLPRIEPPLRNQIQKTQLQLAKDYSDVLKIHKEDGFTFNDVTNYIKNECEELNASFKVFADRLSKEAGILNDPAKTRDEKAFALQEISKHLENSKDIRKSIHDKCPLNLRWDHIKYNYQPV